MDFKILTASVDMSTRSKTTSRARFLLCLGNDGYKASLEPRKLYRAVADSAASRHQQVRVVDESGEDYLFPAALFAPIALPVKIRKAVLAAG